MRGSALRELSLADTPVADLTPLAGTPLETLSLQGCRHVQDLRPLLSCAELEHLHLPPGAKRLDALRKLPHLRFIEEDDGAADKPVSATAAGNTAKPPR